jgi:hypothetical protein
MPKPLIRPDKPLAAVAEEGADVGAKSFYKMAKVLDCFSRTHGSLSLTEIMERTGLPRTTIHRIVASLREIGLCPSSNDLEQGA